MKTLLKALVCLGVVALATVSMKGDDEIKISKQEFERLWATRVAVVGEIESYVPGKGDALIYEYDGHMHPNSDSIAVVRITTDEKQPVTRKLRVSVPDGETQQLKLLRQPGKKLTFLLPLLFVKYDPWGFVPFNELKEIAPIAVESQKPAPGKASGVK